MKKENPEEEKVEEHHDESSWVHTSDSEMSYDSFGTDDDFDSEDETEENKDQVQELKTFLEVNQPRKAIKRSSTYLERKERIITDFNDQIKSIGTSEDSGTVDNNYGGLPSKIQKTASLPLSVTVNPPKEEEEKIEKKEEEAVGIIKKLVSAHKLKFSENDFKNNFNIFQNVVEITQRVRYLELHDIELEEKEENEIENEKSIMDDIMSQFKNGRSLKQKQKVNSTIEQFLLENNLQRKENIIHDRKKSEIVKNSKKINVSKQMTMDSQVSKQSEDLSSPMNKARRLTMKIEDNNASIFK